MIYTNKKRKNRQTEEKLTNCFLIKLSGEVAVLAPLLLMTLLCVHYESAEGVLVQTPTNTSVIVNHSTFFNCSKSSNTSTEPAWYHHPLVGARQDVYEQRIRDKYKDRFSIDKNITSWTFNLLVLRPQPTDAGRYECVEDFFKDKGSSAELTVLDSNLICESDKDLNEIVGPTACAKPIELDHLQIICSVTYSGNFPPQMKWRKSGSELESSETKCAIRGNRVMCNATLEANLNMDGSVYICEISTAEQYNCSLKVNKTIYTFSDTPVRATTTREEAFCSANTSKGLPCSYKWYKDNKTEQLGQTLKPSNPGLYRCEAECEIRNETCAFTAMVINASEPDPWNRKLLWLLVIPIIPLVAVLVYCVRRTNGRAGPAPAPPQSAEERHELLPDGHSKTDNSDDAIGQAIDNAPYMGRGLSGGEIHGPMQYRNRQCTCERIKCTNDQHTQTNEEQIAKEEKIRSNFRQWTALDHNNLIKLYDVVVKSQAVFIVMEHAAGSIRDALKKCTECKVNLEMSVVKDWATQIAKGMEYLHKEGIVHKNLNSVRILIMEPFEASDIFKKTLKISQFCLIDDNFMSTHVEEKFSFKAPEVFDGIYDKEGDVWSFGIVIWEILTRRIPYEKEKALDKIINDIRQGAKVLKIPDSCPKALKEILKGCRSLERSQRPSFIEIVENLQAWQLVSPPA